MLRFLRDAMFPATAIAMAVVPCWAAEQGSDPVQLERDFRDVVQPFVTTYCAGCHGREKQEAQFDLSPYTSLQSVVGDLGHWQLVLERLSAGEMPPDDAPQRPEDAERRRVIGWIERVRRQEAERNAGDPGPVPPRRLSNAEYNYSIHDLTGVDIAPTRDFPVDPANEAGFDNTAESLAMSPALLNKYLSAARHVADHLLLLPDGLQFAPYPVVVYSDRDKLCVHRIVDFYEQQPTDYGDYFFAAWYYRHRANLGDTDATLAQIAERFEVSNKYLDTIWAILTDNEDHAGPIVRLREAWNDLPVASGDDGMFDAVRSACDRLGEMVIRQRRDLIPPIGDYEAKGLSKSAQPLILWKDRDIAANRRKGRLPDPDGTREIEQLRAAITRFCSVFPDTFYVAERGRMFEKSGLDQALDPDQRSTGRLLSAGFHLMFGYFRDDAPLYELILDDDQQGQLDEMWDELIFVTRAPIRQFSDFIYFERAEGAAFFRQPEFDFAREDTDITSREKIQRLAKLYVSNARRHGVREDVLPIIDQFFLQISAEIRQLETAIAASERAHRAALLEFAERAWRRPLTEAEQDELVVLYRSMKENVGLSHEEAIRDTLVFVLMSPHFSYRVIDSQPGPQPRALSDYELASRLSYFLWSSVPDAELLNHAAAGDLGEPEVLLAQTRRMLQDPRIRRLATEFGGHWLEFRRFQSHNGVNRDRFAEFTDDLRQAMYEEPIRFFTDLIQRNGSVLEFIEADHTMVNRTLAEHYGIPFANADSNPGSSSWVRVDHAAAYGRGGLLPMGVFLTANSPGLRTSPVQRGYWTVRRLLGEHIPPPPPEVPELPEDESQLGELSVRDVLAKHREIASCAQCHSRFDSIGLAFEAYGPVGERRERDLGGRAVDNTAVFPDGSEGNGVPGLKRYLRAARQEDFIDNLCRKLLSYGLGRTLLLSDEPIVQAMKDGLTENNYEFEALIETIVTSPQFLQTRGRDYNTASTIGASPVDATITNDGDARDD